MKLLGSSEKLLHMPCSGIQVQGVPSTTWSGNINTEGLCQHVPHFIEMFYVTDIKVCKIFLKEELRTRINKEEIPEINGLFE